MRTISESKWLSKITKDVDRELTHIRDQPGVLLGDRNTSNTQKELTKKVNEKKYEDIVKNLPPPRRRSVAQRRCKRRSSLDVRPVPPSLHPERLPIQDSRLAPRPRPNPKPHRPMPTPQTRRIAL